jgi:hypothetical protein
MEERLTKISMGTRNPIPVTLSEKLESFIHDPQYLRSLQDLLIVFSYLEALTSFDAVTSIPVNSTKPSTTIK